MEVQCLTYAQTLQLPVGNLIERKTKRCQSLTCRQKALIAGIGMIEAMKNAQLLHREVVKTVTPIRFIHSPV
jgi:hypothetical protein